MSETACGQCECCKAWDQTWVPRALQAEAQVEALRQERDALNVSVENQDRLYLMARERAEQAEAALRAQQAREQELVKKWRQKASSHDLHAHHRDDPYDDFAHEHRLRAYVFRGCADELAALASPQEE